MAPLALPKDCFCFSLKTGCVIIAFVIAGFSLLLFVNGMTYVLLYEHMRMEDHSQWPDITYHIFRVLQFECGLTSQLMFSLFLLYGIYKDKSEFTMSWLLCELACAVSFVLDFLFTHVLSSAPFEYLASFALLLVAMTTVFSYYLDQPKRSFTSDI